MNTQHNTPCKHMNTKGLCVNTKVPSCVFFFECIHFDYKNIDPRLTRECKYFEKEENPNE